MKVTQKSTKKEKKIVLSDILVIKQKYKNKTLRYSVFKKLKQSSFCIHLNWQATGDDLTNILHTTFPQDGVIIILEIYKKKKNKKKRHKSD